MLDDLGPKPRYASAQATSLSTRDTASPWHVLAGAVLVTFAAFVGGYPTATFEVLFGAVIAARLIMKPVFQKSPTRIAFACIAYVLLGLFVAAPASTAELKDFATIYKFFYYLAGLALISSGGWLAYTRGVWLYRYLLLLFVVIYTFDYFVKGEPRPTVFTENNYELIPLILMAVALAGRGDGPTMLDWAALLYVCGISGSRSSIVAFVFGLSVLLRLRASTRAVIQWAVLGIAIAAVIEVLIVRLGDRDFDAIDRVVFLNAFLHEVSDWGILQWLVGAPAITPLTAGTCQSLSYYETLLSYTGDGSCYSVILHSFVLRVIFDHGILGLITSAWLVHYLLLRSQYEFRIRAAVLMIIAATGLSVSSLNNVYVALGLMFMAALRPLSGRLAL